MTTILVCDGNESESDIWRDPVWSWRFDRIETCPLVAVADRYDILLPADEVDHAPITRNGISVAFLCTQLESFEALSQAGLGADLIFCPSPIATIDATARCRRTLTVSTQMAKGDRITRDCLQEETGGKGIGAENIDFVIGRPVCYDLAPGTPLDFGMIL